MITTARPEVDFVGSTPQHVSKTIADLALNRTHNSNESLARADTLGDITLRPHQVDAVQRISESLAAHSGALLADSVGLGKTFTAIAIARQFKTVHVLAPAGLLPMWRSALQTAAVENAQVYSLHTFSRRAHDIPSGSDAESRLVIVDEAHHLRTRNTIRYRNVANFCTNARVLLISATPLHNDSHELRNLLALFLGTRDDLLDSAMLSTCVIRRNTGDVAMSIPRVEDHTAPPIAANMPVLELILTLAPPLPVADGAHASALVRLGMLRAWCSSDAALTSTIRRRQLRGEALLHSLVHGRYPTQRELQSWVVGHDSVQLGFPELLVASASAECAPLLGVLTTHLDSLQHLLTLHTKTANSDATRASYLRQLLHPEPPPNETRSNAERANSQAPIIAFSQFASTVRALHRALSDIAGIASLTSAGGQISSGTISREQVINNFSPRSNGRPPPPEHERIRLLLTTDLLSEGVNLQDAGTVVHLDLPWTDALRQQRIGRVARMGSRHAIVHSHTIEPPTGSANALHLVQTLERKAGLHKHWIGENAIERDSRSPASLAETSTALRALLKRWRSIPEVEEAVELFPLPQIVNASIPSDTPAFLAVVEARDESVLLAATFTEDMLPTADVREVHRVALLIDRWLTRSMHRVMATEDQFQSIEPSSSSATTVAMRQIDAWIALQHANEISGPSLRELSHVQHRALRELARRVEQLSAISRSAYRDKIAEAERQLRDARGAGSEAMVLRWLEQREQSIGTWLDSITGTAELHTRVPTTGRTASVRNGTESRAVPDAVFRVRALMILQPQSDSAGTAD